MRCRFLIGEIDFITAIAEILAPEAAEITGDAAAGTAENTNDRSSSGEVNHCGFE